MSSPGIQLHVGMFKEVFLINTGEAEPVQTGTEQEEQTVTHVLDS